MARRRNREEHQNHEAWAIPYADLMTLLLAFFVVMYALSSLNESKYRTLADALNSAFGGQPRSLAPIQVGGTRSSNANSGRPAPIGNGDPSPSLFSAAMRHPSRLPSLTSSAPPDPQRLLRAQRQMGEVADQISAALAPLVNAKLISVRRNELWIEVEIHSDILFTTGSAHLDRNARATLSKLAAVLRPAPNGVRVEGHADDRPIANSQFPSNWELSAARAASVVHLFADEGLAPRRLEMVGYGEFRPRADNHDEAGRNANRRVVLIILADPDPDPDPDAGEAADVAAKLNTAATPRPTPTHAPGDATGATKTIEGEP